MAEQLVLRRGKDISRSRDHFIHGADINPMFHGGGIDGLHWIRIQSGEWNLKKEELVNKMQ